MANISTANEKMLINENCQKNGIWVPENTK